MQKSGIIAYDNLKMAPLAINIKREVQMCNTSSW